MSAQKVKKDELIRAVGLRAGYGEKVLWRDANFSIRRGEFVGVLGPNGAGKSTLFRLLLGLNRPASGSGKIGYVPQRRPIDDEMRIEALEFVRIGLCGNRWGFDTPKVAAREREQALAALLLVDGEQLAARPLGELSGGEMQRVFLAQALVGKPELLLLDEPLANLDIRRETELVQVVSSVARSQNVAVVLIAHDINPLLPVVDRIIYIVNGRVATGKLDEVVTSESLSKLYDAPVEVLRDSRGRIAVLGTEETVHHG